MVDLARTTSEGFPPVAGGLLPTRKILKRLRVMPGYSGGRPMVVDEQGEDAFAVFDTAAVTR